MASGSITSIARIHGRGLLLSCLEKELILIRIKVIGNDCFSIEAVEWDSYWTPLRELGLSEIENQLDKLHSAWGNYIHSGFNQSLQRSFCYCYFVLLDTLVSNFLNNDHIGINALQLILGFECFGISNSSTEEVLGAGTCSLRNPSYLLAKLKMPTALDDAQFLPVITVPGTAKPELFTHYRQYTISRDSSVAVFLYPIGTEDKRSLSFELLNTVAGILRYGSDPWTNERANLIYKGVIKHLIQTANSNNASIFPLEFFDVGAGSGSLVSRICQQIQKEVSITKFDPKFRVWSIDLKATDPARFFKSSRLRKSVDSLTYIGNDFKNWLNQPLPLPKTNSLRITLVSKLLDVFSKYSFQPLSIEGLREYWPKLPFSPPLLEFLPNLCLAFGSKGPQALAISNSRLLTQRGRIHPLLSLADYYRSMYFLTNTDNSIISSEASAYLPVRSFNPECLVTTNGKSIISSLAENSSYTIIEDADLGRQNLIDHCVKFSLNFLSIQDMTKVLMLKGNYLYVVWSKKNLTPAIKGEQIW
jgi:hypothetical protein